MRNHPEWGHVLVPRVLFPHSWQSHTWDTGVMIIYRHHDSAPSSSSSSSHFHKHGLTLHNSTGVMIGCGSFGRVYRGTWRGQDVAVKKILHSPAECGRILREIGLSMALSHPHVVRSLHHHTLGHAAADSSDGSGLMGGGSGSLGGRAGATTAAAAGGNAEVVVTIVGGGGDSVGKASARDGTSSAGRVRVKRGGSSGGGGSAGCRTDGVHGGGSGSRKRSPDGVGNDGGGNSSGGGGGDRGGSENGNAYLQVDDLATAAFIGASDSPWCGCHVAVQLFRRDKWVRGGINTSSDFRCTTQQQFPRPQPRLLV
jgi:hypothetical protein